MTRTPMPSPRGTNHEGLFFSAGSRAAVAYDAAPDEPTDYAALLSFLEDKLEDGDLVKVRRMLGLDDDAGEADDRRRGGAFRGASDRKPAAAPLPVRYDAATFPNAARLKG